ncbi:MAG TPA: peptide chain release factor N(5)-glutamine methyltransferase, partial [Actinomycetota bacterium]|nr:peptide chain release factor N(5)-glutamine methyltransferase [Actinomycetota bacterium]
EVLLMDVLGVDRAALYARSSGLSPAEAKTYGRALCRRCVGTPLQHLTGHQPFRRLDLAVLPGVFVPRPETEVVVEAALDLVADIAEPVVVDLGTGTGAIALAIAQEHPGARVLATDLSPEAVALARENAARHSLIVTVVDGDLFAPVPSELAGAVDLVVSNPPYVEADAPLPPDVRADPELALFGGTAVHRRIAEEGCSWLRPGGAVAVEIGAGQGAEVRSIFHEAGYTNVEVLPDLAMRDRVVVARFPAR